ncbi:MAG: hypothetical protein ACFCD0_09550, partial [Gemmataceae bacterium]
MQHLTVSCPACGVPYQLDPELRGKKIRCPNTLCRSTFVVKDDSEPESPPALPVPTSPLPQTTNQVTGTVGSMIPLVSTEPVSSDSSDQANPNEILDPSSGETPQFISWDQPPPVRQRCEGSPPSYTPSKDTPPTPPKPGPPTPKKQEEPKPAQESLQQTQEPQTPSKEPILTSEPFAPPPPQADLQNDFLTDDFLEDIGEPSTEPEPTTEAVVFGSGNWEPPPVRYGNDSPVSDAATSATPTQGSIEKPESGENQNLEFEIIGRDPLDAYNKGYEGQVW